MGQMAVSLGCQWGVGSISGKGPGPKARTSPAPPDYDQVNPANLNDRLGRSVKNSKEGPLRKTRAAKATIVGHENHD